MESRQTMVALQLRVPAAHGSSAARTRWGHTRRADKAGEATVTATVSTGSADATRTTVWAEDLWKDHGTPVYWLAYAVLGDETAATRAVALGMVDFVRLDETTATPHETRRTLARHVYRHSAELARELSPSPKRPPVMGWLAQLAWLQRASLALCCYGEHTYEEAAELLDISPRTAAQLLTAGLQELSSLSKPVISS